jgi:uncharacterized protein (DUF3820 family)
MSNTTEICGPDYVMQFGKYQGMRLRDIAERNPRYIVWLSQENIINVDHTLLREAEIEVLNQEFNPYID